jgi:hypothetical protein
MADLDQRVRLAAFTFLDQQTQLHGETLPRKALAAGLMFDGQRISAAHMSSSAFAGLRESITTS